MLNTDLATVFTKHYLGTIFPHYIHTYVHVHIIRIDWNSFQPRSAMAQDEISYVQVHDGPQEGG